MGFRDREKNRLAPLKPDLFTKKACKWDIYRGEPREFCLNVQRAKENLHSSVREGARHQVASGNR